MIYYNPTKIKLKPIKKSIFISLFLAQCIAIQAQDHFTTGMKYFETGNYTVADSFFTIYLKKFSNDKNAIYNQGITKLYLKDTASFCNAMSNLKNTFNDADAAELFYKVCGSAESVFFDNSFNKCVKKKARYTEVTETNKYKDYKTVYIHDKRQHGEMMTFSAEHIVNLKTDIIAEYQLNPDGSKVYFFVQNLPKFLDKGKSWEDYKKNNPILQKAKEELKLNEFKVAIRFIIDKNGDFKNAELYSKNKIEKEDVLLKYINLILLNAPKFVPGSFRNEKVDCWVVDIITF